MSVNGFVEKYRGKIESDEQSETPVDKAVKFLNGIKPTILEEVKSFSKTFDEGKLKAMKLMHNGW